MRWLALALTLCWLALFAPSLAESARSWAMVLGWAERAAGPLGITTVMVVSALGYGQRVRGRLFSEALSEDPLARRLFAFALGLLVIQAGSAAAGLMGLLSRWMSLVLLLPGVALALFAGWRDKADAGAPQPGEALVAHPPWLGRVVALVLLAPWWLWIVSPPTGPDELQYQVRIPAEMARSGGIHASPTDPVTAYFGGLHVLFVHPILLGGIGAVRTLSAALVVAGALAGERLTFRLAGGLAAHLYWPILAGAASFARQGVQVGSDAAQGLPWVLCALLLLDRAAPRRPFAIAALAGLAFSMKLAAPVWFAPFWLLMLAATRDIPTLRRTLVSALIPLLCAVPWLLRNLRDCGHPLYPLFGLDAPGDLAGAIPFDYTAQYGGGTGLIPLLHLPRDLFFWGREFDARHHLGRLNPWPLFAAPALLLWWLRDRAARPVAVATLLAFLGWALTMRRVAYLLVLWPAIAAVTAVAIHHVLQVLPGRRLATAIVGAVLLLSAAAEVASPFADATQSADVATGRESEEAYLDRTVSHWPAARWVADNVPETTGVLLFGAWPTWALPHALHWTGSEHLVVLRINLLRAGDVDGVAAEARRLGARWILYQRFHFWRESYPELDEATIERTFTRPLALAERFLAERGALRFEANGVEVWEILDAPAASARPTP